MISKKNYKNGNNTNYKNNGIYYEKIWSIRVEERVNFGNGITVFYHGYKQKDVSN